MKRIVFNILFSGFQCLSIKLLATDQPQDIPAAMSLTDLGSRESIGSLGKGGVHFSGPFNRRT